MSGAAPLVLKRLCGKFLSVFVYFSSLGASSSLLYTHFLLPTHYYISVQALLFSYLTPHFPPNTPFLGTASSCVVYDITLPLFPKFVFFTTNCVSVYLDVNVSAVDYKDD